MDGLNLSATRPGTAGPSRTVPERARTTLSRWIAAAAQGVSRAAINRRVVRQLSVMSDRELKDIGLVRQDVLDSRALPPDGDASSFLIGRRDERRGGRRVRVGDGPTC